MRYAADIRPLSWRRPRPEGLHRRGKLRLCLLEGRGLAVAAQMAARSGLVHQMVRPTPPARRRDRPAHLVDSPDDLAVLVDAPIGPVVGGARKVSAAEREWHVDKVKSGCGKSEVEPLIELFDNDKWAQNVYKQAAAEVARRTGRTLSSVGHTVDAEILRWKRTKDFDPDGSSSWV